MPRCHPLTALAALLLLAVIAPRASAQAWTMPRGAVYAKISYGHVTANEQFTFDGRERPYVEGVEEEAFRDRSLYLYAEAGLLDHLTLVLSLPYKRTFVRDQAFRYETTALGTATLGARVSLLPLLGRTGGANALSANVLLYVPTGYTRNYAPSAGTGQVDLEASLFYGRSFWPLPVYAQAGLGYRYRSTVYAFSRGLDCQLGQDINCTLDGTPDFGEELTYHAEVGATAFGAAVLVQGLLRGVWSVREPNIGFSALNPLPTRQRYLKVGGGVALYPFRLGGPDALGPLGLSVQYVTTPTGRNTIASDDWFVGVEYRFTLSR